MKKVVFSGIQPSGNLTIGNYIGAIQQWVKLQNDPNFELMFFSVDLHAITVPQDPKILREKNLELTALYIACGIDPKKSKIFIQSENPDHTYLGWVLDCFIPMGWMSRMTQFKDKSLKQAENTTVGLFNYPALMAADILLYDTNLVPVGEDQKQHIEFTRDVAEKFNKLYGQTFTLPAPMIDNESARIMSLQNPSSKMSKSDKDPLGAINLLEDPDSVRDKIKRAITDSGSEVKAGVEKPALTNLLAIYSKLSGMPIGEIEEKYKGKGYGVFKEELAAVVVNVIAPIKAKYTELRSNKGELERILDEGRDFSRERSRKKLAQVKKLVGLGR